MNESVHLDSFISVSSLNSPHHGFLLFGMFLEEPCLPEGSDELESLLKIHNKNHNSISLEFLVPQSVLVLI